MKEQGTTFSLAALEMPYRIHSFGMLMLMLGSHCRQPSHAAGKGKPGKIRIGIILVQHGEDGVTAERTCI